MSAGRLAKYAFAGVLGLTAGVVGAISVRSLLQWLRHKEQGSAVQPDVSGRMQTQDEPRHLKLYHSFPFRSCRCAWVVNELGINSQVSFEEVQLHGTDAQDLMAYREIHPHGTLPSLSLEDDSVLLESAAICLYLAECFVDASGTSLLPDPEHIADYYNMIVYGTSTFDHILEPLYMQLTHTPEDQRDQSMVNSMRRKFNISANVLSGVLSDQDYICGSKFTAADCVIGYDVWWASVIQGGNLLEDYPVLRAYLDRLKERPAFEKTFNGYRKPSGGSL